MPRNIPTVCTKCGHYIVHCQAPSSPLTVGAECAREIAVCHAHASVAVCQSTIHMTNEDYPTLRTSQVPNGMRHGTGHFRWYEDQRGRDALGAKSCIMYPRSTDKNVV